MRNNSCGGVRRCAVGEYRPFVKDYLFAEAAGHYTLDVSDAGVSVAFYGGDVTTPSRTFRLR